MSETPGSATKRSVSDGSSGAGDRDKSVKESSNDDDDGKEDHKEQGGGVKAGSDGFSHDGLKALLRSISQASMSAGNRVSDSAKSGSADPEKDKTVVSTSTACVKKKINSKTSAAPLVDAAKPSPLDSFLRIGKESVVVGDAKDAPPEKQGGAAGGSDSASARPAVALMMPQEDDALGVERIAQGGDGCTKKKPVNLCVSPTAEGLSEGGTPSLEKVAKGRDEGAKKTACPSVCPSQKGEVMAGQGGGGTPSTIETNGGPGERDIKEKHGSLTGRFSEEKASEHGKDTEKPMSVTLYSNVQKVGGGWWGGGTKKPVRMVPYTAAGKVAAPTAGDGQKGGGAMNGLGTKSKLAAVGGTENRGSSGSSGSSGGLSSSPGSLKNVTTGLGRGGGVGGGGKKPVALPSGLKKVSGQRKRQQAVGNAFTPKSVGASSLKAAATGGQTGGVGMTSSADTTAGATRMGTPSVNKGIAAAAGAGEQCDGAAGIKAKKSAMLEVNLRKQRPRSPAMPVADIFTRGDNPPPGPEKGPSTPGQVRIGIVPFRLEGRSKCSHVFRVLMGISPFPYAAVSPRIDLFLYSSRKKT